MPPISCLLLLTFLITTSTLGCVVGAVGVNWGTMASHPLPPFKVVKLLKSNNINKVKLFDANSDVLQSLSGSNIAVTVGIPNAMLRSLNSSKKAADSWVHDNVTRYMPNGGSVTRIDLGGKGLGELRSSERCVLRHLVVYLCHIGRTAEFVIKSSKNLSWIFLYLLGVLSPLMRHSEE
ncbi:hypothetical protein V8G54_031970 [Vigna mungo]|uniref:glucan endo-1,3-beta-D-glucosidase n=1 Tax=Vigna mungo TaxID=3915 RepID=A0AAQ3MKL8_VIGMU